MRRRWAAARGAAARPEVRWSRRIADARAARDAAARRRVRRTVTWREGMRCEVDGRELLNFCSNDYLGLSQHPQVIAALRDGSVEGVGSTASALVCGHHALHATLEREVADWLQAPAALLFGSGFTANLAVLQALLQSGDTCVQDRLNHASLIDAAKLSGATLRRYPHNDAEAAARQLATHEGDGLALIATDGVFSMDGDVAPLRELAALAHANDALLYVDDAHGVGVLGPDGRGSVAGAGLSTRDVPLQLATLGKALGTYGALVVGDADLVGHLAETARGHVYSTALPPALAAASIAAVRIARAADDRRAHLAALVAQFRGGASNHGLDVLPSTTPIQAVMAFDDRIALRMAQVLEDAGFWVSAIRPPTVPEGRARLRVTLTAAHTESEVDTLVDALARARDAAVASGARPA
ncbi:8-amino-7-oxononanoate synthase [Lysobacter sp. TY2-98]|uniref:8-amino-7-oxononanoate synthase n=1 Tax=Lysobacter sp. TY2-98 TaxID=2290922 RepID=UPI000E2068AC|nr:8-amino-7-oxononanoate synthase [Lysobacter sp. TY2-98]AXK73163.1 8-amino-7-oxononanoate synthase [Lysobacter sp. TY2-98]